MTTEETELPHKRSGLPRTALAVLMVVLQAALAVAAFYILTLVCIAALSVPVATRAPEEFYFLGEIVTTRLLGTLFLATIAWGPVALLAGFVSALVAPRLGKWRVLIPVFPIVYAYSQTLALAHETMQGQHLLMTLAILCAAPGAMLAAYVATLVVPGAGWRPGLRPPPADH